MHKMSICCVFLLKPWHNLLIRDIIWLSITLEQSVLSMMISQFVLLRQWIRCYPLPSPYMPRPFLCVPAVYVFNVHNFALLLQLLLLKSIDNTEVEWGKEVKGSIYDVIVEGFQLLSRWTARIWDQCAWKFSRPSKEPVPLESHETSASFSDYEKVYCPLSAFILFFLLICNRSSLSSFHLFLVLGLESCNKPVSLHVQWIFWGSELYWIVSNSSFCFS